MTPGAFYKFKVEARNSVGYSLLSVEIEILAAQVPNKPMAPVTTQSGPNMIVTWSAPYNGGTTITAYQIIFQGDDGLTYSEETNSCDGTGTIVTLKSCIVPSYKFITAPFSLSWGSSLYAKVIAINVKGGSVESDAGNGGVILTQPDSPINVQDVPAITSSDTVGLTWTNGLNDGGSAVIDYRVSYN